MSKLFANLMGRILPKDDRLTVMIVGDISRLSSSEYGLLRTKYRVLEARSESDADCQLPRAPTIVMLLIDNRSYWPTSWCRRIRKNQGYEGIILGSLEELDVQNEAINHGCDAVCHFNACLVHLDLLASQYGASLEIYQGDRDGLTHRIASLASNGQSRVEALQMVINQRFAVYDQESVA